jgi:hypothetical protein
MIPSIFDTLFHIAILLIALVCFRIVVMIFFCVLHIIRVKSMRCGLQLQCSNERGCMSSSCGGPTIVRRVTAVSLVIVVLSLVSEVVVLCLAS